MSRQARHRYSLEAKPANRGTPTMDSAPTVNAAPHTGARKAAPRSSWKWASPSDAPMSRSPVRNSSDLASAWAIM